MSFGPTTQSREKLNEALSMAMRYPHAEVHKGGVIISPKAFEEDKDESNILISRFALIDCTGFVYIGPWCNITARCRIYTHDHIHAGRRPLLSVEKEYGVIFQDKYIGADVSIYDGAIVLYQATHIPDGVILAAGSVLNRNPGPYEIWGGIPAKKIGERLDNSDEEIQKILGQNRFRLSESLKSEGEIWC